MKSMDRIGPVDRRAATVEVGGGAIWREVMLQTWRERLVPPVLTNNQAVTYRKSTEVGASSGGTIAGSCATSAVAIAYSAK